MSGDVTDDQLRCDRWTVGESYPLTRLAAIWITKPGRPEETGVPSEGAFSP